MAELVIGGLVMCAVCFRGADPEVLAQRQAETNTHGKPGYK